MASANEKLKEILERRKAAAAKAELEKQKTEDGGDPAARVVAGNTEGDAEAAAGVRRMAPDKALGRAQLIERLKKKKTIASGAGGVVVGPPTGLQSQSSTSGGASSATPITSRAALLERLRQKKEQNPSASITTGTDSKKEVMSDGKVDADLMKNLEKMKISPTYPPMKRGSEGKGIKVSANVIRMRFKKDLDVDSGVFEYHVSFNPPVDNVRDKKAIIRQQEHVLGKVRVFDGATLCLPFITKGPVVKLTGTTISGDSVELEVKAVKRKPLKDCEHLFNVLFMRIQDLLKLVEIKRNHYDPEARMMVPQHKLEIWPGYVVRVQEMEGGLMLTCDPTHKVLRNETAYTMMKDIKRKGGDFKAAFEKALLGAIIMTKYNRANTYRVDGVDFDQTPLSTFTTRTGGEISYQDYYKKHYNIEIEDLQQPLLIHRSKRQQINAPDIEKIHMFVPELCTMTGLTDSMRNDFRVMKDVALFTRITPDQRQMAVKKFLNNVHGSEECKEILSDWGLELAKDPIKLDARVIAPGKLVMGNGVKFSVNSKADWTREATSNTCLVSVPLDNWHVVCTAKNKEVVHGFIKLVKSNGPKMGISVNEPSLTILPNDRTESYTKDLHAKINENLQLVVCIVPLQREDRYGVIKKLCNTDRPVPSQVVCAKTISNEKKVVSVVQKIILQINCKLGGQLWGGLIPFKGLMCVGIDVYHDPTRKHPSVLGAVANMNNTMSSWKSLCKIQRPGQEIIDSLKTCIGDLMKSFKEANGSLPEKIILFRDGVGDGQLDVVALFEAAQIEGLFKILGVEPEFTFVIVQKRINLRFFELTGNKYGNPPPGSVLDHTIMKRTYYDFLLVSQHVGQGAATPTHYIVIRDTSKFSPDDLQKISYKLTHMYYNWPGTLRVPAPCQYAHKLAYQVGEFTKVEPSPLLSDRLFFL